MKNSKQRKVMFLLIMLLAVTVGFALLSTTLKINGTTSIKSNTWDIHWKESSISVTNGSVNASTPTVNGTNNDTVNFSVNLELPGDFYEFSIDAENSGTIDGAISLISPIEVYDNNDTLLEGDDIPDYINFVVKYADGTTPAVGDVLKKTKTKKYKIRIEIDSNAEDLPSTNKTFKYKYKVEYEQYKAPTPDINSSWQDIIDGYESGDTKKLEEDMENGTTRNIDLGTLGVHKLRIANITPCSKVEVTSKTSCGLVLEFADIITGHRMNPYNGGEGASGGWPDSEARTYVNSTIYNSLPLELRGKIIDTNVVSGHESGKTENYTTTDKIYLLSAKEVWNSSNSFDTADGSTRQLDYYRKKGVTYTENLEYARKIEGSNYSSWWMRSAMSNIKYCYVHVSSDGNLVEAGDNNSDSLGISPAFRLAN